MYESTLFLVCSSLDDTKSVVAEIFIDYQNGYNS